MTYIDAFPQEDWIKRVRDQRLQKHAGPGAHPNGSPQSVHAGGGGGDAVREQPPRWETLEDRTISNLTAYHRAAWGEGGTIWIGDQGGKVMKAEDQAALAEVFNGATLVNGRFQTKLTNLNVYDGEIEMAGDIIDLDNPGEVAGQFTRVFKGNQVKHDYFGVQPGYQGLGIGEELTKRAEQAYRDIGIDRVYVQAGMSVGGYAWARAGFQFDPTSHERRGDYHPYNLVREMQNRFVEGRRYLDNNVWYESRDDGIYMTPSPSMTSSDGASSTRVASAREWDVILQSVGRNHATPQMIATLGQGTQQYTTASGNSENTWLGKEIMLGSQWDGVKDLNTSPVLKAAFLDEEFPTRRDSESEQAYLARLIATCPTDVYDTPVDSRSVQKHYGPGLHPNGTSQGAHAGRGGGWRPSMTRQEAEEWSKDSAIRKPLTHSTSHDVLPYITGEKAVDYLGEPVQTGFRPSMSGLFGPGIYLGSEPLETETIEEVSSHTGEYTYHDGLLDEQAEMYSRWANGGPTVRAMVNVKRPLKVYLGRRPLGSSKDHVLDALSREGHEVDVWDTRAIDVIVQENGYDSIAVFHEGENEPGIGGDQVVVYDPKNVTVISDDEYRYRKHFGFDPFGFEKHKGPGNHPSGTPQAVHAGGGASERPGPLSMTEARKRLQAAFPRALISLDESTPIDPRLMSGMVHGFERMAKAFPKVAEEVVMIRTGPQHTTTVGLGEQVWTGVRAPDGDYRRGLGFLFNANEMTMRTYETSVEIDAQDGQRMTTQSVESPSHFAEHTVVHEFGHAVHSRAMKQMAGQWYFEGFDSMNRRLWNEMTGVAIPDMDRFSDGTFQSMYPYNERLAKLAHDIDEVRFDLVQVPADDFTRNFYGQETMEAIEISPHVQALSPYAAMHRGETFAEAFAVRHGPEGTVGKMPPGMDEILDMVEEAARS